MSGPGRSRTQVLAVADDAGRTPAQVALRWLLQQPGVTAPIIGARTVEQLEDNLGATGWSLTDAHAEKITPAGDRPLPYPYGMLAGGGRSRSPGGLVGGPGRRLRAPPSR